MVELCGQSPPLIAEHAAFIEFENINTIIQTEHLEDCEQEMKTSIQYFRQHISSTKLTNCFLMKGTYLGFWK